MTDRRNVAADDFCTAIRNLREMSIRALARMYVSEKSLFCHCIRRRPDGDFVEGLSPRYTAIVLIGLATEALGTTRSILGGVEVGDVCGRLLRSASTMPNLGDVALTLWAGRALGHDDANKALDRLRALDPVGGAHPTVEVAWALSSLVADGECASDEKLARRVADRLLASFRASSGVFSHWPTDAQTSALRGHVSCFADLVYPVQALAYYHMATGAAGAIEAAKRCGAFMAAGQGERGQWWWHFDVRTGRVVEPYPVYAVHQDAMAPMALFALEDACGASHQSAVERGVRWLSASSELGGNLVDKEAGTIWRKVARHEPGKLCRGVQAIASSVHPSLRVPGMDLVFRPGRVDYESRPYHLGWLLHAWTPRRLEQWSTSQSEI